MATIEKELRKIETERKILTQRITKDQARQDELMILKQNLIMSQEEQ